MTIFFFFLLLNFSLLSCFYLTFFNLFEKYLVYFSSNLYALLRPVVIFSVLTTKMYKTFFFFFSSYVCSPRGIGHSLLPHLSCIGHALQVQAPQWPRCLGQPSPHLLSRLWGGGVCAVNAARPAGAPSVETAPTAGTWKSLVARDDSRSPAFADSAWLWVLSLTSRCMFSVWYSPALTLILSLAGAASDCYLCHM